MKKLTLAVVAIVVGMGTPAVNAQDTIRFATEGAYPPFNERAPDGSLVGFEIDLGMAMCAKVNRKCEFVAQDWDGMIPGLLVKKFDGIFASMAITEERKKQIDFTNKYYQTGGAFVAPEGTKIDLNDAKLGAKQLARSPAPPNAILQKSIRTQQLKYIRQQTLFISTCPRGGWMQSSRMQLLLISDF